MAGGTICSNFSWSSQTICSRGTLVTVQPPGNSPLVVYDKSIYQNLQYTREHIIRTDSQVPLSYPSAHTRFPGLYSAKGEVKV